MKEKLVALEEGGTKERPIDVVSASVIEPQALAQRCARCDGELRLREHAARTFDGSRLREVQLTCARCGSPRTMWFRIVADVVN